MGTVLYSSVLYCIKMRKFAHHKEHSQNVSKTEVHSTRELANSTILYNTLNYGIVSRHQINTCTVLYSSVLYCIKIRKFADRHSQNVSKTEVHSTRELANFVAFNVSDESSAKVSICTV